MKRPLSPKKQKYLQGLVQGKTKTQAALDAGYAETTARAASHQIETPNVREAFAALIRRRIPGDKIAKRLAEGLDAKETKFFQHEGVVKDQRNVIAWSERRQSAELAATFGGYFVPPKQETNNNIVIPIQILTNTEFARP